MKSRKNNRNRNRRLASNRAVMATRNKGRHSYKNGKRKLNKKRVALVAGIFLLLIYLIVKALIPNKAVETSSNNDNVKISTVNQITENEVQQEKPDPKVKKEITDWNLRLANFENILPEDFEVEVANIDKKGELQFDARAIKNLNKMMNQIREDGILNIWVQSAYRSVSRQKELYDNKIKKYLKEGKTQEEAEKLTDEYINKPGASDHNLGLAVDFNNVDNSFEDLDAFKWLKENAEEYGFILRYPKDKEEITQIAYESWHWRYVGEEHAKKMNELNMCLEEYIEYLQNQ